MLAALVFAALMVQAAPPQQPRAERTRQFLGLGPAPDAAAAQRGEPIYQSNCSFCHGAKANGAEGPDLIRSSVVLHDEKGELIAEVVLKGRPAKGMPKFDFTPAQIYDIAEFLHLRVDLAVNRGLYHLQNIVTGNAKAGDAYFNGAGGCKACHAVTGDLAHIGSKFSAQDLQTNFLYPTAIKPPQALVTLPGGETITGTIKKLDDFTVSIIDSSGDYHSWPRSEVKVELKDPLHAHRELLAKYTDADIHNLLAYLVTLK